MVPGRAVYGGEHYAHEDDGTKQEETELRLFHNRLSFDFN